MTPEKLDQIANDLHYGIRPDLETCKAMLARAKTARDRAYYLAYAITGGDDAPGLLESVTTDELCDMLRSERQSAQAAGVLLDHLQTEPILAAVERSVRVSHFASALRAIAKETPDAG